jgi:hypothetical protein
LVLSNDWWCGQRIRDVGGTSFVCAPNNVGEVGGGFGGSGFGGGFGGGSTRQCLACEQLTAPPLHGALPEATHVAWRVLLGPTAASGDYDKFLEKGPKEVLDALHLLCIQKGINIPLEYPPVAGKGADAPSTLSETPSETLLITCESIRDSEDKAVLEACLTSRTEHSIECEADLHCPAVDALNEASSSPKHASAAPRKLGSQLWKKLAQARSQKPAYIRSLLPL